MYASYCYFFSRGNIEPSWTYQYFFHLWRIYMYILPIYGRSIKWRKSEERQLMKWAGIFQVGIFRGWIFQGGVSWVGIFRVGIFLEPLRINTFFYCAITIYIQFILFKASHLIHSFVWFEKYKSGICFIS